MEIHSSTQAVEEYDELDRKIDRFLAVVGRIFRVVLFLAVASAFLYFVLLPNLETWGPYLLFAGYMVFQLFFAIMFMIVQFVALFWFIGRPRIYWVMPGETGVSFNDYKGNPEVLDAARQVVTLLRGVKDFKGMGGEPIRGLLLVGSPGTGKSYLGQCIATEAGVPFGYMSAPSIRGMFWGMDTMRVMGLYGKARKLAQKYGACIIFIDEIDAIGASRTGQGAGGMGAGMMGMMGGGNGALNELLNQMDPLPRDSWKVRLLRKIGLRRKKAEMNPVLTMGATNIADVLDPALLRPGRFDRQITVDLPDADGRREIIEYYVARIKHDLADSIDRMVGDTIGYTPVKIRYVINEAVVVSHWDGRDLVTYKDWSRAIENHEFGLRQPIKSMSMEERRRLAYHETGHALAMVLCMPRERLHKVTIIRHGSALGFAAWKPKEETYTMTKEEFLARIRVSLASRAAEQEFLGIEMSGAHHDLQTATQFADMVIRHYGMSGSLYQPAALGQYQPDQAATWKIEELLEEEYQKVRRMLQSHTKAVHAIAATLVERLELTGDEVVEIIEREEGAEALTANGHGVMPEEVYGLPGIFSIVRKRENGNGHRNGVSKPPAPAPEPEVKTREAAIGDAASEGM